MVITFQLYLSLLLAVVALVGDFLVSYSTLQIYRALFDNTTHAIIGGLSWFIIVTRFRNKHATYSLYEVLLCTIIASFIDLDHFIAAKSLHLKDATNLQTRPILHSSTIPIIITITLLLISYYFKSILLTRISMIVFVAFASHHTRDATRRGYLFRPFGSTPPIPYYFYITLTLFIPQLVCFFLDYVHFKTNNSYSNFVLEI